MAALDQVEFAWSDHQGQRARVVLGDVGNLRGEVRRDTIGLVEIFDDGEEGALTWIFLPRDMAREMHAALAKVLS